MYMKASDAISGKEGSLFATIDGNVVEVAECKNINAKITKNKTEHKATGWTGTGSMVIHYASSRWAKMMIDYAKSGKDTYFKLVLTNEDPTSSIGRQQVTLIDCNMDESEIAKLDTEAEFLDESANFTFSDVELNEEFGDLS